MDLTSRELLTIELGLAERQRFLEKNLYAVPDAPKKLEECKQLLVKVRTHHTHPEKEIQ